ncbi:MAG: hypothetical protein H7333_10775 [Bdellovibrionales bacterium]|nr:hypothetical protein [Oligoflexia bacterium]
MEQVADPRPDKIGKVVSLRGMNDTGEEACRSSTNTPEHRRVDAFMRLAHRLQLQV